LGGIFISYRRTEGAPYAGRLADALSIQFGADQVFLDINSVNPGERFPGIVEAKLSACEVLLAVIGPTWLTVTDTSGQRRIDNPDDLVRSEIATALGRPDVLVIPILIGTTSMPAAADLPNPLARLAECNAVRITDETWGDQMARVIRALEKVIERPEAASVNDYDLQERVIKASLSARDLLQPEVLPNIDRLADLTSALGKRLSNIPTPLAVIGEGGLGKSVLLRQFFDRNTGDGTDDPLPILVLCSNVPSSADLSSAESLDAALGTVATGGRDGPPLTTLINEIAARQPVLILLDTVDLIVNDHNVDEVVYVLRALAGGGQLIFTCREQEYLNFLDNERGLVQTRYQLPVLDVDHVKSWARQYTTAAGIDAAHRDAFIASLTTPAAAEVCATPLRLAMACKIYAPVGAIPEHLTVTELYNQYWNRRIAVDRHGKGTATARAQEVAADAIASEMWDGSRRQFVVSAPGALVTDDAALQRLCSDGLLRKIGGRYQFFHQTYAEYAVARRLSRIGSTDDLQRLHASLQRGAVAVAGLWPVARHLVMLEMPEDRYAAVAEAIPLTETEGVRLHFVGAFHRRDADRVVELAATADAPLLSAAVTVLADAPPECLSVASDLALRCLEVSTSTDMELIASTCARLYMALLAGRRPAFLRRFLQAALGRQPHLKKETLPSVICRFIANTVAADPNDSIIEVLISYYVDDTTEQGSQVTPIELPEAARAALLKLVDAQPASAGLQTRLLSTAARGECPSGAADAVGRLLVRNWPSADFRRAMGWVSVDGMLEHSLPERWNACQVRLADALCEDGDTARDMLAIAFSDADLHRDRWANVAKYIADRHRDLVVDKVLALPDDLSKPVVGTACTVVNHVADALTAAQRAGLGNRLRLWISTDPRRVWPTLIKVSTDDTELLRDCARRLLQSHRDNPTEATSTTVRSSFDTFLNACTPSQLAALDTDLRALLLAKDKQDRTRLAELDGLISAHDLSARQRVAGHLNGTATNAAYAATRGLVAALEFEELTEDDASTAVWLYGLLDSRHANVVRRLAEALDTQSSHIEPPPDVAESAITRRFAKSIDSNEDPQTISALLALVILLERRGQLVAGTRTSVVDHLKRAVAERLPTSTPTPVRQHLPALFNLHKQALAALAIPHCNAEEVERLVRTVLTDIDIADIAGRSERTVAHLLITAASRAASILPLLEELWPTVSDANKGAIAECITYLERHTAGERSKRLARRDDCPVAVQNQIHTRFRL
jgi:hypothetical protein